MTQNRVRQPKQYSLSELLLGNLAIILWIILGSISFALFYPLAALPYFAVAAFLVFYEMGKHGCVSCFLCKTCTIGMGKLPGLFFRQERTLNANRRALRLFPYAYILMSFLPIALTALSLSLGFDAYKVALLAALLAFSLYSGAVWARRSRAPA